MFTKRKKFALLARPVNTSVHNPVMRLGLSVIKIAPRIHYCYIVSHGTVFAYDPIKKYTLLIRITRLDVFV